jgi:glucose-1-phosphate thymidylyltransferase
MILYPLATLVESGITDVIVICGREHASHFMNFLGSGRQFGARLSYAIQDKNDGGIADALAYAEDFADRRNIAVILGDNIFEDDFASAVRGFVGGAMGFFKRVADARRFGVPAFDASGRRVVRIQEKPPRPPSPYAQVGFYLFDPAIFDVIRGLTPSARGQLEITDAANRYIEKRRFHHAFVRGFWADVGTFDSLMRAARWLERKSNKT